jgi:23S rRNA pseudouridine1911/1915/1917 synthase
MKKPMKFSVEENRTLFDLLRTKFGESSTTKVRKMIKHGAVAVDGKAVTVPGHLLAPGQIVEVSRPGPPPPFPVLFEDSDLIALLKPAGLLSITTGKGETDTFYRAVNDYVQLRSHQKERVFIVHRLDKEVSGVMLLAKTVEAKETLQRNWGGTDKQYAALVEGRPPAKEGTVRGWLKESSIHKVYSCPKGPDAKYAVTHYRVLKEYPWHTLLEIRLETGRKNQIRAHLSELGCPIVGDKKYGAAEDPLHRLALHASRLSFTHPVSGKRITLESPVPGAFLKVARRIEGKDS